MDSAAPSSPRNVVYDTLRKVHQAAPQLKPIPAFEVYKVAREEELAAYRMLCRVLVMHHGTTLPKAQQRILEDMGEQLCISESRRELEQEVAAHDDVLLGIRNAGVLRRRGDFTDGVEEMTVAQYLAEAPKDDGNGLYAPSTKTARLDGGDGAGGRGYAGGGGGGSGSMSAGGAATAVVGAKKKGHVHAAVSRLAKEIEASGKALLFSSNPQEEQQLIQSLQQKRDALVALKEELLES
ncbi:hypothetical protein ABB37_05593 [Leptomonas pyrrhocoris]|uniref:ENT domain-containing protein n=1 Tax=Leptomonas pyrrhocoris TaxID=157538 RepID=A0A0M9FZ19_LEPPY|nr:hypothetical protein ABB37_05593 [Leptomonas pyrrhocoris]KPA79060.1 hypothetical protein ABB37_05593 [Leptomonas pyrrhocoris]|eukprot:XP_015657499.1 hypothetical protein ABB37_05593 [Leptomonas pyrrhocoris]